MIGVRGLAFGYRPGEPLFCMAPAGPSVGPAADGLDLDLGPGLVAVVGPNGSGKSTLLRLLAGVLRPDRGAVAVGGYDLWREEVAARRRLIYLPEQPQLHPFATVGETARFVARLHRVPAERLASSLERLAVAELATRLPSELSAGQQRRVHLALALATDVDHLLLDEPFDALDQGAVSLLLDWLDRRVAAGATALVVSHLLEPLLPRAHRVLQLGEGRARAPARLLDPHGWSAEDWRRVAAGE